MLSKEEIEISNIEVPIPLNPEELEREYRDLYIRHKILLGEKQNLIEKLEEDIRELEALNDNYTEADIIEGIYTTRGQIIKANEILSILKGE